MKISDYHSNMEWVWNNQNKKLSEFPEKQLLYILKIITKKNSWYGYKTSDWQSAISNVLRIKAEEKSFSLMLQSMNYRRKKLIEKKVNTALKPFKVLELNYNKI